MRISDWSSDVCSSDLRGRVRWHRRGRARARTAERRPRRHRVHSGIGRRVRGAGRRRPLLALLLLARCAAPPASPLPARPAGARSAPWLAAQPPEGSPVTLPELAVDLPEGWSPRRDVAPFAPAARPDSRPPPPKGGV